MENSMSLKTIANEYKNCIRLIPFFTMCMNTSSNLNKPSDRFAKGGLHKCIGLHQFKFQFII